jgi:hypothetical protein
MATTDTYGTEPVSEKVAKERILWEFIDCIVLTPDNRLGIFLGRIARIAIIDHKNTIGQLPDRTRCGKGLMRKQAFYRIIILHLMRNAWGDMHAIPGT